MHEQVYKYEEVNLKVYAKDDKQLERYGLFRNVTKAEVKEKLESLVSAFVTIDIAYTNDESVQDNETVDQVGAHGHSGNQ